MKAATPQSPLEKIKTLGKMTKAEASDLINEVYRDAIVSRGEADALFALNARLTGPGRVWDSRFIEAICDYLLTRSPPEGWVTDEEAEWLVGHIAADGKICTETELELLLVLLRKAEGAPRKLAEFTLDAVGERIIGLGRAEKDDVERLRRALYAQAGDGALWVTRAEASLLFRINDTIAFAKNAPAWNDLFARALANHLLAAAHPDPMTEAGALAREAWLKDHSTGVAGFFAKMGASLTDGSWFEKVMHDPEKAARARLAAREAAMKEGRRISREESDWFLKRLGWDKKVSPAERALIDFLKDEAPGFAQGLAAA